MGILANIRSMLPNLDTAIDLRDAIRERARSRRVALNITQAELSARSGVPLGTLKRFELTGEVALTTLLALADALDALSEFHGLFPLPEARTLLDVERQSQPFRRVRARKKAT